MEQNERDKLWYKKKVMAWWITQMNLRDEFYKNAMNKKLCRKEIVFFLGYSLPFLPTEIIRLAIYNLPKKCIIFFTKTNLTDNGFGSFVLKSKFFFFLIFFWF